MFHFSAHVGEKSHFQTEAVCVVVLVLVGIATAGARKETVLYTFQEGASGHAPTGPLVADSAGNLFGTTELGGSAGFGTVFEMTRQGSVWKHKVLYSFKGGSGDGTCPSAGLIFDQAGNIYGTTGDVYLGCIANLNPTVFELSLKDGVWSETVLWNFGTRSGRLPTGNLVFDGKGNLYGTTTSTDAGSVFQLKKNSDGSWSKHVLHQFQFPDTPAAGVVFGKDGVLYGTILDQTGNTGGTAFTLTPPGGSRHSWSYRVIYRFNENAGFNPDTPLILRSGNLYGATAGAYGYGGTVFELTPPVKKGALWNETTLYTFTGLSDGSQPDGLLMDKAGNIYGTTFWGGLNICNGPTSSCGVVFEISPQGTKWTEKTLYDFTGKLDGSNPTGGVIFGKDGALYGVTSGNDQESNLGTVFRVVP